MKKTIYLFLCLLFVLPGYGQLKKRKVVQVLQEQTFYLNGGLRSQLGGKSRTKVEIRLPANTVEWYYIFTTSEGGQKDPILNLVPQLTRAFDPTGGSAVVLSAILAPTGSKTCDIFLMDQNNSDAFVNKVDQGGGSYRHYPTAARENFRQGVVQVQEPYLTKGIWYLGFRNPSASAGVDIKVEVAAIVEEYSTEANKAVTYGNMGWKAFEAGDVDRCIELSKKALELDNSLGYVKANLGLCYLIKNEESIATDYYVEALTSYKALSDKQAIRRYIQATISDINTSILRIPGTKAATYIRELFQGELNNIY